MFCNLQSKRVLVTGASSGIGQSAAELIARAGGTPILLGRNNDRLIQTRDLILADGFSCGELIAEDLSEEAGIDRAVNALSSPINGIVFSAGISKPIPLQLSGRDYLLETLSINTISPFLMLSKLQKKRKLSSGSSIVFISSIAALTGTKGTFAYAASKGALNGAVKALADELGKKTIRVNAISPAVVRTGIWTHEQEGYLLEQEQKYPLGLASSDDIAASITFLLSDSAITITGQNIVIDSGCTDIS